MNSGQCGLCHAEVGSGRRLCAPRLRRNTPATSVEGTLKPREDCSCDCVVRGVFERARAPRRAQNCMLLPLRPQPLRSARTPASKSHRERRNAQHAIISARTCAHTPARGLSATRASQLAPRVPVGKMGAGCQRPPYPPTKKNHSAQVVRLRNTTISINSAGSRTASA